MTAPSDRQEGAAIEFGKKEPRLAGGATIISRSDTVDEVQSSVPSDATPNLAMMRSAGCSKQSEPLKASRGALCVEPMSETVEDKALEFKKKPLVNSSVISHIESQSSDGGRGDVHASVAELILVEFFPPRKIGLECLGDHGQPLGLHVESVSWSAVRVVQGLQLALSDGVRACQRNQHREGEPEAHRRHDHNAESEKGVRSAQEKQAGPCIPVETQL